MRCLFIISFLLIAFAATAQINFNARLIDSDVGNFWRAFDLLEKDTTNNPFREYFDRASEGLKGLQPFMIKDAETIKRHVLKRVDFYRSIREKTYALLQYKPQSDYLCERLHAILPNAHYPSFFFIIGIENTSMSFGAGGLVIALETLCYSDAFPDPFSEGRTEKYMIGLLANGLTLYNTFHDQHNDLLSRCLYSGTALFVAEFLTRDLNVRQPGMEKRKAFGENNFCMLWKEFVPVMKDSTYGNWIWHDNPGRPRDIGYWMGYKIASEFYAQYKTNPEAISLTLNCAILRNFTEKSLLRRCE